MTGSHLTSRPRVLVVEDDQKLALLLCRALREENLEPDATHDGKTALGRLSTVPYEAVLLDVGLPGISGLQVCAALRRAGSSIPVIMLSARDGVDDVEDGRRAGATDYFLKPFSVGELTTRLDDLIRAGNGPHGRLIGAP